MKGGRYILAFVPLGFSAAMAQQRPNILVMIADDMARCELGCYGGQNLATPNIDRVANEGMLMTSNFASAAMSVPIRASMYTGLYPVRNGSYRNHKATYRGSRSVTHFLSELGYRVGRTGKDHPANQPKVYA
ncbi:MAG: sulfatase-like hydrolase/transferase, partial [Bacteroidaceae bacterium]|nr:sulfatase-like hydrolase/transferase [Bacteroidaceae bacterium]